MSSTSPRVAAGAAGGAVDGINGSMGGYESQDGGGVGVEITLELIRKKAEHNAGMLDTLEELSLHQLQIGRINEVLGNCTRRLRILYLQNNLISKLENLQKLKELDYLNVALNNLSVVENLERCECLRKLDMTVNFVDVDTLEESCVSMRGCANLAEVYLTGNPCTTFEGYRLYVIAMVPQITKLDGTDVAQSERIVARQSLEAISMRLKKAAAARRSERLREQHTEKARGDVDGEERVPYTPEARLKMYKDMEEQERQRQEADSSGASKFEQPTDPLKEKQKEMSRKVVPSEDGSLPRQRNIGKLEFTVTEDRWGNIVVDIAVPRFLDTSEMDVDIHPLWFQVIVKGKNTLLHLPAEVNPDKSRVQRMGHNGHLVLTMPKVGMDSDNVASLQAQAQRGSSTTSTTTTTSPTDGKPNAGGQAAAAAAKPQHDELIREVSAKRSEALLAARRQREEEEARRHGREQEQATNGQGKDVRAGDKGSNSGIDSDSDFEDDDDVPPLE